MMTISWDTTKNATANVHVTDGAEGYWARVPTAWTEEQVAGAFLEGYSLERETVENAGSREAALAEVRERLRVKWIGVGTVDMRARAVPSEGLVLWAGDDAYVVTGVGDTVHVDDSRARPDHVDVTVRPASDAEREAVDESGSFRLRLR